MHHVKAYRGDEVNSKCILELRVHILQYLSEYPPDQIDVLAKDIATNTKSIYVLWSMKHIDRKSNSTVRTSQFFLVTEYSATSLGKELNICILAIHFHGK